MHIQNFNLTAGEDRTLTMRATTQAGAVLNLTGATILWRLSQSQGGTAVLEEAGSIVSASAGTFSVTLSDEETSGLGGQYYHQALVTISGTTTAATAGKVLVGTLNQPVAF